MNRCSIAADVDCERECRTECYRCGNAACKNCSKFRPAIWFDRRKPRYAGQEPKLVRREGKKRICDNCWEEEDRESQRLKAKAEARAARQGEVDAFIAANPGARQQLRALGVVEKTLAALHDREARRARRTEKKLDGIRKEIHEIAYRLGEKDDPPSATA